MEIIRQAIIEDSNAIKDLIKEFYDESLCEYGFSLDEDTINETIQNFVNNHIVLLVEKDNKIIGIIAGIVAVSIFDKKQRLAQEAIWYITKDERKGNIAIKLIEEFEKESKKRGANFILMGSMGNLNADILNRLYEIKKYKLMERHYIGEEI